MNTVFKTKATTRSPPFHILSSATLFFVIIKSSSYSSASKSIEYFANTLYSFACIRRERRRERKKERERERERTNGKNKSIRQQSERPREVRLEVRGFVVVLQTLLHRVLPHLPEAHRREGTHIHAPHSSSSSFTRHRVKPLSQPPSAPYIHHHIHIVYWYTTNV